MTTRALFLKWILVGLLLVAGFIFLLGGLGVSVPFIRYNNIRGVGQPVGAVLLVAGILVAAFWRIESKKVETELPDYRAREAWNVDMWTTSRASGRTSTDSEIRSMVERGHSLEGDISIEAPPTEDDR